MSEEEEQPDQSAPDYQDAMAQQGRVWNGQQVFSDNLSDPDKGAVAPSDPGGLFYQMRSRVDEVERRLCRANVEGGGEVEVCAVDAPTTIGDNTEGLEAADATAWAVADSIPVSVWMTSRVGYFESGDAKLYGYKRKLSYDACGKLVAVSAETRYLIDAPENCA